jgi:hypothetical protein
MGRFFLFMLAVVVLAAGHYLIAAFLLFCMAVTK